MSVGEVRTTEQKAREAREKELRERICEAVDELERKFHDDLDVDEAIRVAAHVALGELDAQAAKNARLREALMAKVEQWDHAAKYGAKSPHWDTRSVGLAWESAAEQLRAVLAGGTPQ